MTPINLQAPIHLLQLLTSRQQLEGKDAPFLAGKTVTQKDQQNISWYSLTIFDSKWTSAQTMADKEGHDDQWLRPLRIECQGHHTRLAP